MPVTKYLRTNVSFGFETAFVDLCVLILKSKPEIAIAERVWNSLTDQS